MAYSMHIFHCCVIKFWHSEAVYFDFPSHQLTPLLNLQFLNGKSVDVVNRHVPSVSDFPALLNLTFLG